jgi:hypothetical protein
MLAAQVILVFPLITSSLAGPMNQKILPVTNGVHGTENDKYAYVEINLDKICPHLPGRGRRDVTDRKQIVPSEEFCECIGHLMKCDLIQHDKDEYDKCEDSLKRHDTGCEMPKQGLWSGRLYKHEHITVKDWMTCSLLCEMDAFGKCTGWSFGAKNNEDPNKKTCYLMAENGSRQPAQRNMVSGFPVELFYPSSVENTDWNWKREPEEEHIPSPP